MRDPAFEAIEWRAFCEWWKTQSNRTGDTVRRQNAWSAWMARAVLSAALGGGE